MTIQSNWTTEIADFRAFKRSAETRPATTYLLGSRPVFPKALTVAAIAEERSIFWVDGPGGWRARVVVRSRAEIAEERREQQLRGVPRSAISMVTAILEQCGDNAIENPHGRRVEDRR